MDGTVRAWPNSTTCLLHDDAIADRRREFEHVATETFRCGTGMAGLVEAATDAAPEVLREGSREAPVCRPDYFASVEIDLHFTHFR